jgi:hypothetical protein
MKKWISLILVLILFLSAGLLSGCGLKKTTDGARAIVDEYYEAFSKGDIETVTDLMHESLVENLGGRDATILFFSSIRAVHGSTESYKIEGFETEKFEEGSTVLFNVNTDYEYGLDTKDEIMVVEENDIGMSIISIDIPTAGIIEELNDDFVLAYANNELDEIYSLVIPAVKEFDGIKDSFYSYLKNMNEISGPVVEITNSDIYPNLFENILEDKAYLVCISNFTFQCENGYVTMEVYIAQQDGQLGIADIVFEEQIQ